MTQEEKYLREQIPTMIGPDYVSGMKLTTMIALLRGYHESEVEKLNKACVIGTLITSNEPLCNKGNTGSYCGKCGSVFNCVNDR